MGKTPFKREWLCDERFSSWLQEAKTDKYKAKCIICGNMIDLGKMGDRALVSHMSSKKHGKLSTLMPLNQPIVGFFKDASQPKQPSAQPSTSNTQPPVNKAVNIDNFVSREETLRSEILWTIHTVVQHNSYKSNDDISKLFPVMFPDSNIAKRFTCGERKTSYLAVFGISEYFKQDLLKEIRSFYSVLFDESLNKSTQKKQMDIHVRYWNEKKDQVCTRFFQSVFLGHGTAQDMVSHFTEGVIDSDLKMSDMVQIGMDGPNVNWKFFHLISDKLKNDFDTSILNVGSCGLHVMHNSFRTGARASGWNIESLLTSIYYLFKDSPARREDIIQTCNIDKLPLKFCCHRWLENESVAKRAIEIWPDLLKYIEKVETKKLSKPSCNSYKVLLEHSKDKLIIAKLEFFKLVSSLLEPFLTSYQTDRPVLPMMADDLSSTLRSLLRRFVNEEVLKACDTMEKLSKVDLNEKDIFLSYNKINIGINTEQALRKAATGVSEKQIMDFRIQARNFLCEVCKKLLNKCPLSYSLVRNISCLNPNYIATNPSGCQTKFKRVLVVLKNANKVGDDCDIIAEQYYQFVDSVPSIGKDKFLNFSKESDRLDIFYSDLLKDGKYEKLLKVVKLLLVISHGQASVERGFSVNKEVESVNLSESGVVARRIICDYVTAKGGIMNVEVTKGLLLSAASAKNRYDSYLDEQRHKKQSEEQSRKRKNVLDELEELKKKKKRIKTDIDELILKADNLASDAEKKGKISLITQSNCLRKRSKEKEEELKGLESMIEEKVESLKN